MTPSWTVVTPDGANGTTAAMVDRPCIIALGRIVATFERAADALRAAAAVNEQLPEPPEGCRLILASEDLFELLGTRSEDGRRLSYEWGEPDEHGWYTPIVTSHQDPLP
jgi:hypothetical protein